MKLTGSKGRWLLPWVRSVRGGERKRGRQEVVWGETGDSKREGDEERCEKERACGWERGFAGGGPGGVAVEDERCWEGEMGRVGRVACVA